MYHGKLLRIGLGGLLSVLISTQLFGQEDVVKKRKDLMQSNNAAIKAIKGAVETKDYGTVEAKAKDIMGNSDQIVGLFPKGSTAEKSRAHPDIWEKSDEFGKRVADLKKAATELSKSAAAKDEADVNVKVKALGNVQTGACGEC